MEDLPLGRIEALVPEIAVKELPLGRTLMMMMIIHYSLLNYRTLMTILNEINILNTCPTQGLVEL